MFGWLFNGKDDDSQDPVRKKILEDVERLKEGVLQSPPEMKIIPPPACSMFFIKTKIGTFANTQFKSIHRDGQFIELKFYDTDYTFKCQKTKETYDAIVKAMADAAAKLVPCTINEAPTPYGMFSYHENPYPGPTGEDLIVDIDAIMKEVRT
jgi:hypothetical protein